MSCVMIRDLRHSYTRPHRLRLARQRRRFLLVEQLEPRVVLSATSLGAATDVNQLWSRSEFTPNEILIGFEGDVVTNFAKGGKAAALEAAGRLVADVGLYQSELLMAVPANATHGPRLTTKWTLPKQANVPDIIARLQERKDVAYAEPNYVQTIDVIPNDPDFGDLWGINNTGQTGGNEDSDIDAPEAWDVTTGSKSIVVGVIDTGVDYTHEDLVGNIWTNPGEIAGDGVDNDGNGYIDDIHGWDFINNDSDPFDDNGHGTHVSGTIGAMGDNGIGVAGVNWDIQIMGLKFLSSGGGGNTADAVEAVNYATMMRKLYGTSAGNLGAKIVLTSNSWGGGGFSQALEDAIAASGAEEMLFVAAAGNGNTDTDVSPHYPSSYELDNVISVAATDHNDDRASFSNYGLTTVDLAAPGVSVLSTLPGDQYGSYNGTSMATPHVSGVAAMAWGVAGDVGYTVIRDAIFDGVDPINSMDGITVTGGRLNAFGALQHVGMVVGSSEPAAAAIDGPEAREVFTVNFSYPVLEPVGGLDAGIFEVNDVPASSVTLSNENRTATFRFDASPVTEEGLQVMTLAAGSVATSADNLPAGTASELRHLREWTRAFRWDVKRLALTANNPDDQGTLEIPASSLGTTSVHYTFNEPVDKNSVGTDDLVLTQGEVIDFVGTDTDSDATTYESVEYKLGGIVQEETLSVEFAAGALTDVYGNPNLPGQFTYELDWEDFPYPTPLKPLTPLGSLAYAGKSVSGFIHEAGDSDSFMISIDPDQRVTVVVQPNETLAPSVVLSGPGISDAADNLDVGQVAIIQNAGLTVAAEGMDAGEYKITVGGNDQSTGAYTLWVYLNLAWEDEQDTPGGSPVPQDLSDSFIPLVLERAVVSGSIEDNNSSDADASGYEARVYAADEDGSGLHPSGDGFAFDVDISASGNSILSGVDDDEVLIGKRALGFSFPFYGKTYNQVLIGSNGQLTFEWQRRYGGIVNNSPSNDDLTIRPEVATIAPLWDDLEIAPDTSAGVYWEVIGDKLYVQWDHVRIFGDTQPGEISFQAVLDASDGTIQFNYKNLASTYPGAEGSTATVGIKGDGVQGDNRLLLAYNEGPNRFVGTGLSTLIGVGVAPDVETPDYYQFTLGDGERVTLALDAFGGDAHVELKKDLAGNSIALAGTGFANADAILEFVDNTTNEAADTYYAVVTGDTRVDYNLLVTRGLRTYFEKESNSGPTPWEPPEGGSAQPIDLVVDENESTLVLGTIGGGSGGEAVVGYYTDYGSGTTAPEGAILAAGFVPLQITDITTFDFSSIDLLMLNESNNSGISDEVLNRLPDIQTWVEGGGVFMVHDRFVTNDAGDPQANPFLIGEPGILLNRDFTHDADIDVIPPGDTILINGPAGVMDDTTLDGGNSSSHGFVLEETFPAGALSLLSAGPIDVPNHVAALSYGLNNGAVYYSTIPLDFYLGGSTNFNTIYAPNMLVYGHSLAQPEVDIFEISVESLASGGTLMFSTALPAAGGGEHLNGLDPMLRLYSESGILLASNDDGGDGRNAKLNYAVPPNAGGLYYIEVLSSEVGPRTRGEYVLTSRLIPAPPPPGMTVSKSMLTTTEGGTDTFNIVLDTDPGEGVTVTIALSSDAPAEAVVSPSKLTFTSADWHDAVGHTVTVNGVTEFVDDGDQSYEISVEIVEITGDDTEPSGYHEVSGLVLTGVNLDDDEAGITVAPTGGLVTTEGGGTDSFQVHLDSQPTAPVTIRLESSDPSEGLVSTSESGFATMLELTFDDENWNQDRVIYVQGQKDGDHVDAIYTIVVSAAVSADEKYGGNGEEQLAIDPSDVTVLNRDDDGVWMILDDFEDRNINEYRQPANDPDAPEAKATRNARHDGKVGLEDKTNNGLGGWLYRDHDVSVEPGDAVSVWVRSAESVSGRAYFGFGASEDGTWSVVMGPNSGSLLIQRHDNYGYADVASVSQEWLPDHWYRFDVALSVNASGSVDIIARLFDSDGVTLLNTVTATETDFKSGGIAFRAFGSDKHFDTVQKRVPSAGVASQFNTPLAAVSLPVVDEGKVASLRHSRQADALDSLEGAISADVDSKRTYRADAPIQLGGDLYQAIDSVMASQSRADANRGSDLKLLDEQTLELLAMSTAS